MSDQTPDPTPQTEAQAPVAEASTRTDPRRVWLVEHPTHQYAQDVKALAKQHALQIVDAAVASADDMAHATEDAPTLTLRADEAQADAGTPPATAATPPATAASGKAKKAAAGR